MRHFSAQRPKQEIEGSARFLLINPHVTSDGQALKPSLLNPRGLPLVSSHRSLGKSGFRKLCPGEGSTPLLPG